MDLISRLKFYLDTLGVSVTQFADECGIPRPTASQLLAGRNKKVSDEIIGKIHAKYPALSIVWLMFGEGEMVLNKQLPSSGSSVQTDTQTYARQALKRGIQPNGNRQDVNTNSSREHNIDADVNSQSGLQFVRKSEQHSTQFAEPEFTFAETDSFSIANQTDSHLRTETTGTAQSFEFSNASASKAPEMNNATDKPNRTGEAEKANSPLTLRHSEGRRVIGIVVYYNDRTFESFSPDEGKTPPFIIL